MQSNNSFIRNDNHNMEYVIVIFTVKIKKANRLNGPTEHINNDAYLWESGGKAMVWRKPKNITTPVRTEVEVSWYGEAF